MSLTTIRSPPSLGDYTPLPEHQAQTPSSFFDTKPILHYHGIGTKCWLSRSQLGKLPFFPTDLTSPPTPPESEALSPESHSDTVEQKIDVFVNSQNLTVFSPQAECGLSIPYHQISIHAIQKIGPEKRYSSVYLQLELAEGGSEEDFETVELTLIPQPKEQQQTEETIGERKPKTETERLFEAISECSNLNPDPVQDGDEDDEDGAQIIFEGEAVEGFSGVFAGARDGGLPPAMPGSSGWITAENVHEYFDEEGNWIGEGGDASGAEGGGWVLSEQLGGGAGTIHRMDEDETEEANGQDGENNKRPKTE
ncbi:regulator of volume decrease after cellular swelling-domain-containing protein [Triangularia verruculosa]|uniref:Regulator of volume decrease after cellular swelling-domain-containing protein n=1 Tax=Triangularia verruculosa TaxID=2587418 RepID=A0AAN7ASP5_9PEZI|nr:regulator of volume decrease after cellular swelling-domain-containing protein [Triangularia verruculosa]